MEVEVEGAEVEVEVEGALEVEGCSLGLSSSKIVILEWNYYKL